MEEGGWSEDPEGIAFSATSSFKNFSDLIDESDEDNSRFRCLVRIRKKNQIEFMGFLEKILIFETHWEG